MEFPRLQRCWLVTVYQLVTKPGRIAMASKVKKGTRGQALMHKKHEAGCALPTASSSRWLRSRKNRNTACYISQIETLLRKHEPVEKHAPSRVRVGFTIIVSKKLIGNSRQIISLWRMKSATTPKFCPDVQSEMCFESRAAQLRSTLPSREQYCRECFRRTTNVHSSPLAVC